MIRKSYKNTSEKRFNIHGLSGINNPSKLCDKLSKQINLNKSRIDKLLKENQNLQGLGDLIKKEKQKEVQTFSETDEIYNKNITFAEKQAWVWYKQSLGIPMFGWEKYFLSKSKGAVSDLVYSTKSARLFDNHFRYISDIAPNQLIGKFLRTSDNGDLGKHYICRNQEGIVIISKKNARIEKTKNDISIEKLHKLVKQKALLLADDEFLPYSIYAYGNMYDRQLQLQKDKDFIIEKFGEDVYQFHYNICHKEQSTENPYGALPQKKSIINPDESDRPFISPISVFASDEAEFSIKEVRQEYMDLEQASDVTMVNGKITQQKKAKRIDLQFDGERKYDLQTVYKKWLFSLNETNFDEVNAPIIVDYYLNNKALRDDKKNPEEKKILKAFARNEGDSLFQKFLHEVLTFEDQQKLDISWNRLYNGQSVLRYDKIPIAFEISRMFKTGVLRLTDMQREALGFLEISGNGIISLDVGGGKTMVMIISLAMGLQQGKYKRPLLIIPKPVYKQFLREMQGYTDKKTEEFVPGVLSHTNIKFNEWFNLGTKIASKSNVNLDKKVNENTITVITKEAIKKLGFTDKTIFDTMSDLLEIFDTQSGSERDLAKKENKVMSMIGKAQMGTITDFDILGFDALYADEAHAYKNIFAGVKPDKYDKVKRYDLTGPTSEFGIRFFFLSHFIQRKYGRNIVLSTATPFQKAILEVYSMLSLVSFNDMKRNNIINLKRFCDMFIKRELEYVANFKEQLELKEVIKSFVNADILRGMINSIVYYRSKENFTNVKLPCKINLPLINIKQHGRIIRLTPNQQVVTYLKMSELQRENQNKIIKEIRYAYSLKGGSAIDRAMKRAAIFRGISNSQKNAFTPFEYDGEYENSKMFVEESPKIYAACLSIKSVKDYSQKHKQKMPGQILYANRGTKYFIDIKEYLDKQIGFKIDVKFEKSKIDEVEIITSKTSESKKLKIQNAFNKGICKVIIGTSTIQEGLNLQQSATDIHVINTEWNPTAMVQLAGRIHRQGNPYGYVRFTIYLLQDSVDVPMFQKNEEKIARINELLEKNGQKVIDGDTLDANEIKYSLITDIGLIVKMDYDKEKEQAEKELKKKQYNVSIIENISRDIKYYKKEKESVVSNLQDFFYKQELTGYFDTSTFNKSYKAKAITKAQLDKDLNRCKKAIKIKEQIVSVDTLSDKELLNLCRSVVSYQKTYNFNTGYWNIGYDNRSGVPFYVEFSQDVSKIVKAEKTILKPKGYDRNSDFGLVLEELRNELKEKTDNYRTLYGDPVEHEKDENYYKETQAYRFIYEKVNAIKNNLDIAGKTPEQVAKDYAKLNYIISYGINDKKEDCSLPKYSEPKAIKDNDKRIRIVKVKAKAKLKLLKMR